jgi:hypothetical protein
VSKGSKVKYPEPTAEERGLQTEQQDLLRLQTDILRGSAGEARALAPYLYKRLGLTPRYDAQGMITGFDEDPSFGRQQELIRQGELEELEFGGERRKYEREMLPLQRRATEQQLALTEEEMAYNREQQRLQRLIDPYRYEEMGLKPRMDETGKIIGFDELDQPGEARREEIQRLQEERSLAALKGELPVDPALTRDLAERESLTREGLRQQLGTGYETTTAGSQSLGEFEESRGMLLDAARRGEMTLAEQLGLNRAMGNRQQGQYQQGLLQGVGPRAFTQASSLAGALGPGGVGGGGGQSNLLGPAGAMATLSGGFGGAMQGFQQVMGGLQQQRGQQFQANVSNAQQQQATNQLYGQAASTSAMVAAVAASSRTLKADRQLLGPDEEAQTLGALMGDL